MPFSALGRSRQRLQLRFGIEDQRTAQNDCRLTVERLQKPHVATGLAALNDDEVTTHLLGSCGLHKGSKDTITFNPRDEGFAGKSGGIEHFGFRLKPGVSHDEAGTVEAAGGRLIRRGEHAPGVPYAYIADPDGCLIELRSLPSTRDHVVRSGTNRRGQLADMRARPETCRYALLLESIVTTRNQVICLVMDVGGCPMASAVRRMWLCRDGNRG
jgi:catechol 2,3-dioxygenase-like lactoylglutathione lyase family enzyme